jgi:hypothetical protein
VVLLRRGRNECLSPRLTGGEKGLFSGSGLVSLRKFLASIRGLSRKRQMLQIVERHGTYKGTSSKLLPSTRDIWKVSIDSQLVTVYAQGV